MAAMRPKYLIGILLVCALGAGAWLWLGGWPGREAGPPADSFAARFSVEAAPPPPALQAYAVRLRLLDALAFIPSFVTAPQGLYSLPRVDLSGVEGSKLALAPPEHSAAQPFVDATPSAGPAAPPLDSVPLPRRHPDRPFVPDDRVLDDAQIASLKQRLKLTAVQERRWSPVETELRTLEWRRAGPGRNGAPTLDTAALLRLKDAFDKLMESLRDDQKREVRALMGIVGM